MSKKPLSTISFAGYLAAALRFKTNIMYISNETDYVQCM